MKHLHSTSHCLEGRNALLVRPLTNFSRSIAWRRTTSTCVPIASHCKTRRKDFQWSTHPTFWLSRLKGLTCLAKRSPRTFATRSNSTWKTTPAVISTKQASRLRSRASKTVPVIQSSPRRNMCKMKSTIYMASSSIKALRQIVVTISPTVKPLLTMLGMNVTTRTSEGWAKRVL